MQHAYAVWIYGMYMLLGPAAYVDMQHEHAAKKSRKDMQHGHAVWTCGMDMQNGHAAWTFDMDMYTFLYTDTYTHTVYTFFHTYMDVYAYMYIYLYAVKISFRYAEFFDEISPKRNETWPWQNEISEKFRDIAFRDETEKSLFRGSHT
jgi:hypothetical protein